MRIYLIAREAGGNSLGVRLGASTKGRGTRELVGVSVVHLSYHVEKKPYGKENQNIAKQGKKSRKI